MAAMRNEANAQSFALRACDRKVPEIKKFPTKISSTGTSYWGIGLRPTARRKTRRKEKWETSLRGS